MPLNLSAWLCLIPLSEEHQSLSTAESCRYPSKQFSLLSPSFTSTGFLCPDCLLLGSLPLILPWLLPSILGPLLSHSSSSQLAFTSQHASPVVTVFDYYCPLFISCFYSFPIPFLQGLFLCLHLAESQPRFPIQFPSTSVLP